MTTGAEASSPCIGVCTLAPGTDTCAGCWRTREEIAEWRDAGEGRRSEILRSIAERRGHGEERRERRGVRTAPA